MAYKKIPQKFDDQQISADMKDAVMYRGRPDGRDAIDIICEITGYTRRTVYDYLDGKIKPSLTILHAVYLATDADPMIGRYLEPVWDEKSIAYKLAEAANVTAEKPAEAEATDIILSASNLIHKIRDALSDNKISRSERVDLVRALDNVQAELNETRVAIENQS